MKPVRINAPWGVLALDAQRTTNTVDRLKGWMGRRDIAARDALLIAPCNSIHTCFMGQPIDVAFLDRRGKVVAVHANLAPRRLRAHWRASAALELRAGRCAELEVRPGVALSIDEETLP